LDGICHICLRKGMANYVTLVLIPVATRSKAWVCGRSLSGIAC